MRIALVMAIAPSVAAAQDVGFRVSVSPNTVYVGQQASYELRVTIPPEVRQRLRRNPEFVLPEARSMLVYDLPVPPARPGGEGPEVHVFRRAIFPLTPGRYNIAAARLTYSLPQSPSFFSREDERTLRSGTVSFVAIEPPTAGRPAGWTGAVGRWRASSRVAAADARVGDPFVLTVRVEGVGNATLLPRPVVSIRWAHLVPEDERVVLDSTPTTLGGFKEYTWLVTPRTQGRHTVPSITYEFFDPIARAYQGARTGPITVSVRPGDLVTIPQRAASAGVQAALSIRPSLDGSVLVALPWPWLWALGGALAPLLFVFASWRRRTPRVKRERSAVELLRSPDVMEPAQVRSLFDRGLRTRTGVALEAMTDRGALAAALRREGVTAEAATAAEALRDQLDAGAYANGPTDAGLRDKARELLRQVDQQARTRGNASLLLVGLAMSALACAPSSNVGADAFSAFAAGQTAYQGADYARARDAFLRAANAAPRDPAAWANLGAAAWQAGDTAAAVLGWQRALRLEPLQREHRARLERVRAPQGRGPARVWPLPVLPIALLALTLWFAGWSWSAWRGLHNTRSRRSLLLIIPALLLASVAAFAEWQARATDLVVIASGMPLRSLPALGAESGAVPLVGEVVRVRERRGVWVHIDLDAGRAGWYPVERTYPLARQ